MWYSKSTRLAAFPLLLAIATLVAGCAPKAELAEDIRPVRVTRALAVETRGSTAFAAEIKARYETDLSFRVAGKILARTVDLGSSVKKGQVLARLDAQDANLNVAAARANLASADSDLEFARAELARYKDLRDRNFVSQGVFDQKDNAFKAASARRDAAAAQASVAGNQAGYTALTADADGVITAVNAEPGQVVSAGQAVVRVARLGEKDAVFNVGENQVALIRANPQAKISLWSAPGRLYGGRVREIAAAADAATRTYQVKVAIADADDAMRWGMSANVGFAGGSEGTRAILLPMTALAQTDDKSGAKPAVWVVGSDQKVQLRAVAIARYGESMVEVTQGLSGGELVVTAGVHKLKAGQSVKPLAVDAGAMASGAGAPVIATTGAGAPALATTGAGAPAIAATGALAQIETPATPAKY